MNDFLTMMLAGFLGGSVGTSVTIIIADVIRKYNWAKEVRAHQMYAQQKQRQGQGEEAGAEGDCGCNKKKKQDEPQTQNAAT